MNLIAEKFSQIHESASVFIADKVRELERNGVEVIKLQTGDPDFATPNVIIQAAYSAMKQGYTHYSTSRGLPELRQAIAEKLHLENKLQYHPPSEILVTHGGVHAVFIAINALVDKGNEVLIIDPCWMPYVATTIIAGGIPVRIPTQAQNGFKVNPEEIKRSITNRTKLLIINSPCNPTGTIYSRAEMEEIAKIVENNNLFVISDEVYEKIIFDSNAHVSFASLEGMRDRTVTINSFSKTYAMTGWRIGYLAASERLVSEMLKVAQYSITNVSAFIQKAAVTALTDSSVQEFVQEMCMTYAKRRELITESINSINGLRAQKPDGAFYIMVDVSNFKRKSAEFSEMLLEKAHVATVPGSAYGKCAEGYVRMTFAVAEEQIKCTCEKIAQILN